MTCVVGGGGVFVLRGGLLWLCVSLLLFLDVVVADFTARVTRCALFRHISHVERSWR